MTGSSHNASHRHGASGSGSGSLVAFPHTRTPEHPPNNNLPLELSSFVGREREIAEIKRLLADQRLLTLTGPGGCGKTRLALAVANDLLGSFEDGVWLVELASLSERDLVPQTVASTLGVRETQGRPLTETLSDHLGSKKMVLVLDNCEHLIEGCAALADALLRACPGLRILATSREALGIAGESAWLVPSLVLPEPGQRPPIEELKRYEAIRLFVERAKAVVSTFELTEQNAPAVARLCRRLDGMPLAIELAAARVKVLTVEQIASRLEDSFGLLTGGSRTAMPRQQTLRATIDWSHELLSHKERVLFRRLSVFAGGFTLEAAEAVCAGEDLEREEVLDLLSHLVDKSLVLVAEQRQGGETRYRLLETVRQYGWQKLQESEETEMVRRQHAAFFLALAEEVEPKIDGADRHLWLERLEVEHDNFRAALRWAQEENDARTGSRLAGSLFWFWFHRGYWSEGRGWLEGALAVMPARTAAQAKALYGAGVLAWTTSDYATARSRLEESVEIWRELGEKRGLAHSLRFLSQLMLSEDEPAVARSLNEESVQIFREVREDEFGLAASLGTLGIAAMSQGDYAAARSSLEEGVAISRKTGNAWPLALALRTLGIVALREDDYERAETLVEESLIVLRELGDKWFISRGLEHLAIVVAMQGDHVRAARLFGAAEAQREAIGASVLPFYRVDFDRGMAAVRSRLNDEAAWEAARAKGRAMTLEQAVEYALGTEEVAPPEAPLASEQAPASSSEEPARVAPVVGQVEAPPELRIFALGAAQVEVGGRTLSPSDFGYAKPKELLFYLLCHPLVPGSR